MSKTAAMLALAGGTGFSRSLGNIGAKELSKYVKKTNKRSKKKQYQSSAREKQMVWSEPKRHVHDMDHAQRESNDLHIVDITSISQGDDLDARFRQSIFVRGCKLHFRLTNIGAGVLGRVRWALIQPKSNRDTGTVNANNEFFRGNKTVRGVDFDAVTLASHKYIYEINPDIYKIYAQGSQELTCQDNASVEPGWKSNSLDFIRYVPVNAKVTFEGISSTDSNTGLMFVYWFVGSTVNSGVPIANGISSSGTFITYFKDMF